MPLSVVLPLSLNSNRNFQAFFKALEDTSTQDHLLSVEGTDKAIKEIIMLSRDKRFLKQAESVVNMLQTLKTNSTQWSGTFESQSKINSEKSTDKIISAAQKIKSYAIKKYPDGMKLLSEYGRLAQPTHLAADDTVGAWTNVAAYAEALVNAAVYANVAVATNVVLAAAVAAVIGVVVA